ncbi:MAG: hypothetical protein ACRDHZ_21240 [Ktedonobacteraceae bacterium]
MGESRTMLWLVMLGCTVTYSTGLTLLVKIIPGLLKRAYDDALFIGVAALAILGAMLAFGSIGITFALFSGTLPVRIFDALLLLILLFTALRTAIRAFRPRYGIGIGTYRVSRIMAGSFLLALACAAIYILVLLFIPA